MVAERRRTIRGIGRRGGGGGICGVGCCCRGRLELICECMETALRCDHALCHRRARETLGGERYIDRERVSRTRFSITRRVIGQTTVHCTQLTTYGYNHCSVGHFSLLSWVYPAYTRTGSLSLSLSSRVVVFSLSLTNTHTNTPILRSYLKYYSPVTSCLLDHRRLQRNTLLPCRLPHPPPSTVDSVSGGPLPPCRLHSHRRRGLHFVQKDPPDALDLVPERRKIPGY